jgi:predicted transcriptional regulator
MILEKIKEILKAEVIDGADNLQMEIKMGCGCDLMSDVLAFIKPGSLLLTGLTNPQVIRTAEMADIKAICFVRGKKPDRETVELAKSKNVPLLLINLPMFEACGKLYKEGLVGCSETNE